MPFDDQRCTVNISSWAYDFDEMNITTDNMASEMAKDKLDVRINLVLLILFEHFPVQRQFWMGHQNDRSRDERCGRHRKKHLCGKMISNYFYLKIRYVRSAKMSHCTASSSKNCALQPKFTAPRTSLLKTGNTNENCYSRMNLHIISVGLSVAIIH